MRTRRALVVAGCAAVLLAGIGVSLMALPERRPLGPTIRIPHEIWVAADPVTFVPDADRPPRVDWRLGSDLESAGFRFEWAQAEAELPCVDVSWSPESFDRARAWFGWSDTADLGGLHVSFQPCDERRSDGDVGWRRYRPATTQLRLCVAKPVVDLRAAVGAPRAPLVISVPGSLTVDCVQVLNASRRALSPPVGTAPSLPRGAGVR